MKSATKPHNFNPLRFISRVVTEADRQRLIAEAAYRRAELRNFAPGGELEDWLAAEAEVDARIAQQPFG